MLLQEYPKLEYVVMDGGSTDETPEILARYANLLAHVESAKDGGQADAVARGFKHTRGEIMAYLNSDDVLAPGALEFVARFFADTSNRGRSLPAIACLCGKTEWSSLTGFSRHTRTR